MFHRFLVVVCLFAAAGSAVAQDPGDLERRVRALEEKIQQLQKVAPSDDLAETVIGYFSTAVSLEQGDVASS